ncbi:hypothetical protein I307_05361 [Cryptococcus deuterogattii 99/473]|uniref:Uncharacterized protein n=1 Tax=Cryptococcus deuterogattii Ram5 TaxID=1296110 RepID=A0A0D0TYB7_9TREE|nr:hypothetical protein I313_02822 [Cryptococcus deuterogattii Ram5]KIR72234.1 hypothetical protein I310_03634 [Cryptococcus deuterogattii CA1014]KIY55342.1 hypothetical protein I307_05361 [Cryptococcus deuterogattii 99/473]
MDDSIDLAVQNKRASWTYRQFSLPDSSRMINPAVGGGLLLDLSAYPSVWAMLLVHRHPLTTDKDSKTVRLETFYIHSRRSLSPKAPSPLTVTLSMMEARGCHTKQMRLRGVLGMERLRMRGYQGRRAGWYTEREVAMDM